MDLYVYCGCVTREPGILAYLALFATICTASFAMDVPGWKTYRSPDYGFKIEYPESMLFYPGHPDHDCDIRTVACFHYDAYGNEDTKRTNFVGASLSVNVLREKRTEQDCTKIENSTQTPKTETINGTTFRTGSARDAWTSHSRGGPVYRAFHQNVCFEIAAEIEEVSIGAFDPGTIKVFNPETLNALMGEMIHTFKFEGSVQDGPGWKVHIDNMCGAVYEYPEGDTVQKAIEYSNARLDSNEVTCSEYFIDHGLQYTVATKANLRGESQFESWLRSAGYPDLSKVTAITKSKYYTEYNAEPYYYIVGQASAFILSMSDARHRFISPRDDRVFRHLLRSFKAY